MVTRKIVKRKSWTKFKTVPNKWYNKKQDIELSIVQKHSLPNKKGRKGYSVVGKDALQCLVNFDSLKSIKSAERTKWRLENQGYALKKTTREGFNKFVLTFKKKC